jgi:hypothetical protein
MDVNKIKHIVIVHSQECKRGERIKGIWCQYNKIGDYNWYYIERGCGQLALDIFYDLIKISNNKHLNTKLF